MAKLIFFGPPGSGKGTYASRIGPKFEIPHISTGDIFREAIKSETPLGKKVKGYLDRGELVPDETVNEIVKVRLKQPDCKKGFILDGYPRTVDQVRFLDKITKIDGILNLILPDEILIEKMTARRICRNCSSIYNIADIHRVVNGVEFILPPMNPKRKGICDKCGSKDLYQRDDDKEKVIKERLEVFKKQITPVLKFYKSEGKIPIVDVYVTRGPDIMVGKILDLLKENKLVK
jgi:adenylate kinase